MRANLFQTSIGKKALMAVSGLALVGFVIMHLLGNLQFFQGPEAINAYAVKLRHLGPLLWVARGVLLLALIVHVRTSIQVSVENRRARGVAYAAYQPGVTGPAARSMLLTGLLLLSYIVYHLLHFTFGVTNPAISHAHDALGRHDVYRMVVLSFQQLPIAVTYVVAMALLFLHLHHGIGSTFQTLGLNSERGIELTEQIGRALALLLFFGYMSIPVAIQMGLLRAP